jgi:hypothetical protein
MSQILIREVCKDERIISLVSRIPEVVRCDACKILLDVARGLDVKAVLRVHTLDPEGKRGACGRCQRQLVPRCRKVNSHPNPLSTGVVIQIFPCVFVMVE